MDEFFPLNEAQQVAVDKLTTLIGGINHIASQGMDVFLAYLEGYMQFETTLVERFKTKSRHPGLRPHLTQSPWLVPTYIYIQNLLKVRRGRTSSFGCVKWRWPCARPCFTRSIRELLEKSQSSKGEQGSWTLTCNTSIHDAFATWKLLKKQLSRTFSPPNQAYRTRSRFLSTRPGNKELSDYVQKNYSCYAVQFSS